ncbi:hypothetical protein [Streptomyces sp. Tue6028]|uniref:hypothetical protein n=1 Tax=Streptomyces sp. Tue6028 TaxID=2036037 RepID=UPI003EB7356C
MALTATTPFQPLTGLPLPALGEREWLVECHCARPVTYLLRLPPQALLHRLGGRFMLRHSITVIAYHADNTVCLSEHQHTRIGKPLTEGCTGRDHFIASCSCATWTNSRSSTKNYAIAQGTRHRAAQQRAESAAQPKGPAVLRELLRFDADD